MNPIVRIALTGVLALSSPLSSPLLADEVRGTLGLAVEVDTEGFILDPTLKAVTVGSVVPSSPAARAGIAAKDLIVTADGHVVTGAKARDLQPLMKKNVGESLRLHLRRPNGEEYDATLVAAAPPAKP